MFKKYHKGKFTITTDPSKLDLDAIYDGLSNCYWAWDGTTKKKIARSIKHSLCFGVFLGGRQIGFSRVLSDFSGAAYIFDTYILEPYRGKGLGKWLTRCVLQHPKLQGPLVWGLWAQNPALHKSLGFSADPTTESYMWLDRRP